MDKLKKISLPSHVQLINSIEKCKNREHLEDTLEMVLKSGGEGLMLNKPNSLYSSGRSSSLLKVKVILEFYINLFIY